MHSQQTEELAKLQAGAQVEPAKKEAEPSRELNKPAKRQLRIVPQVVA